MKIAVCYDLPKNKNDSSMEPQVNFLLKYLSQLGYQPVAMGFTGSSERYKSKINVIKPDLLWNLFKSYNGSRQLSYLGVLLLEDIGLPYTGSRAQTILFTSDSSITKSILSDAKIPPVPYYMLGDKEPAGVSGRWALKPVHGRDSETLINVSSFEDLQKAIVLKSLVGEFYAERYIYGSDFHAVMISASHGIDVVAVGKDENGAVTFNHYLIDASVVANIKSHAKKCASVFGLGGFAIIRFIVSEDRKIYVSDIDTQPILTEDSIFCRGCRAAGFSYKDILQILTAKACKNIL